MIELDASKQKVSILGEGELQQVVGGYCHRGRRHCGGWGYQRRDWGRCGKKDDSYDRDKYERGYEGDDDQGAEASSDVQVANVAVTVNIAQVQG